MDSINLFIQNSFSSFDGNISRPHKNSTFTHYATTLSNIDNQIVALGSGSGTVGATARNNQGFSHKIK